MRELNSFNKKVIEKFSSRQAYTQIKGHYIPIIMDDVSDESVMELEKRKFYMQSYNFTLQGFLIDENEFQVKPAISRTLALFEVDRNNVRSKKGKQIPENTTNYNLSFDFPVGVTSITTTFEYTADLYSSGLDNISSYTITINGLFYGQNLFQNENAKIQVSTNDVVEIQITKINNTKVSQIGIIAKLI